MLDPNKSELKERLQTESKWARFVELREGFKKDMSPLDARTKALAIVDGEEPDMGAAAFPAHAPNSPLELQAPLPNRQLQGQ